MSRWNVDIRDPGRLTHHLSGGYLLLFVANICMFQTLIVEKKLHQQLPALAAAI